jgi:hypothetical protein
MAVNGVDQNSSAHEFEPHRRNYDGFIVVLKRSAIAVAIVTAIVIFIISR